VRIQTSGHRAPLAPLWSAARPGRVPGCPPLGKARQYLKDSIQCEIVREVAHSGAAALELANARVHCAHRAAGRLPHQT